MASSSNNSSNDQAADKFKQVLNPLFDTHLSALEKKISNQIDEVQVAIGVLTTKFELLSQAVQAAPAAKVVKPKAEAKKGAAAVATAAEAGADEAGATATDAAAPAANENPEDEYTNNRMLWWRAKVKVDQAFREKYFTPEIMKLANEQDVIKKKKDETQKFNAIISFIWNHIRDNDSDLNAKITADHADAKAKFEMKKKPEQQNVEAAK